MTRLQTGWEIPTVVVPAFLPLPQGEGTHVHQFEWPPLGSGAARLQPKTLTAVGGVWRDTDVAKRSASEVARRTPPAATRDARMQRFGTLCNAGKPGHTP